MADIYFRAVGLPKAQPRQRSFVLRGKGGKPILDKSGAPIVRSADPSTAEGWKTQVAIIAREHVPPAPIEGPVRLDVNFLFPRPKYLCRKKDPMGRIRHTGKPDRDNCEKALSDALKLLGFFRDDSQICAGEVQKFYAAIGELPGAEVRITTVAATAIDEALQRRRA